MAFGRRRAGLAALLWVTALCPSKSQRPNLALSARDLKASSGAVHVDVASLMVGDAPINYDPSKLDLSSIPGFDSVVRGDLSIECVSPAGCAGARPTAAEDDQTEPAKAAESRDVSGRLSLNISISSGCYHALSQADRDAFHGVLDAALQVALPRTLVIGVDVAVAPGTTRRLAARSHTAISDASDGGMSGVFSAAIDTRPRTLQYASAKGSGDRVILQANLRYTTSAAVDEMESGLLSSSLGPKLMEDCEEKMTGFADSACQGVDVILPELSACKFIQAGDNRSRRSASSGSTSSVLPDGGATTTIRGDSGPNPARIGAVLLALMAVGSIIFAAYMIRCGSWPASYSRSLIFKASGATAESAASSVDAVVVPGGGLLGSGLPPPWVEERLWAARAAFDGEIERSQGSSVPVIFTHNSGNPRMSSMDSASGTVAGCTSYIAEAEVCANYLVDSCKMPSEAVRTESLSFNLIGNAYFFRTMHADVDKLQNVVIITNAFNMKRVKAIFSKIFSLPPFPAGMEGGYHLFFQEVPDVGLSPASLEVLRASEESALQQFEAAEWLTDLEAVHSFLLNVHAGFAPNLANFSPNVVASARRKVEVSPRRDNE